jgi:hypothetical protein
MKRLAWNAASDQVKLAGPPEAGNESETYAVVYGQNMKNLVWNINFWTNENC